MALCTPEAGLTRCEGHYIGLRPLGEKVGPMCCPWVSPEGASVTEV